MINLLKRPYWTRVWIQQELHNNPEVVIHCGHICAPLETWSRTMHVHYSWPKIKFPREARLPHELMAAGLEMGEIAERRLVEDRLWGERNVLRILKQQFYRKATDARDKIYGVLDMIGPWQRDGFCVDYNMTTSQVYIQAVKDLIKRYNSLDVLTQMPYLPMHLRSFDLPTWCPDWSRSISTIHIETEGVANIHEEILAKDLQWPRNYFDCNGQGCVLAKISECGRKLECGGILLDFLREVIECPRVHLDTNLKPGETSSQLKFLQQAINLTQADNNADRREALWRTLISNRCPPKTKDVEQESDWTFVPASETLGAQFNTWHEMLKMEAQDPTSKVMIGISDMRSTENGLHALAKDLLPNGTQLDPGLSNDEYMNPMTFYLLEKPPSECGLSDEEVVKVIFRYWIAKKLLPADSQPKLGLTPEQVNLHITDTFLPWAISFGMATANRKFFTTEKGYMGLAPIDAQPGDRAAVLYGCALPVVLRHDGEGNYKFMGGAYVHGWMCGEAVDLVEKGKPEDHQAERMFTII